MFATLHPIQGCDPAAAIRRHRHLVALIALTIVAAGLRAATIEAQSFWDDELFTVWLVRLDFGDMVRAWWDSEATPPVYYAATWLWSQVFGSGETGLRSLSVVAGTAAVPLVYLVGSRFASVRAGLAAAALVTFNPFLVWYGIEARSYAFLVPLVALGLLVFLAALTTPSRRNLVGWALVSALSLATHYFAFFVIAPQAAWLLLAVPRERRRAVLAAIAAPAVTGAAVLPILLHTLETDPDPGGFTGTSLAARTAAVPKNFLVGYQLPAELLLSVLSALLALGLAVVVVFRARGAERRTAAVCAGLAASRCRRPAPARARGPGLPLEPERDRRADARARGRRGRRRRRPRRPGRRARAVRGLARRRGRGRRGFALPAQGLAGCAARARAGGRGPRARLLAGLRQPRTLPRLLPARRADGEPGGDARDRGRSTRRGGALHDRDAGAAAHADRAGARRLPARRAPRS